MDVIKTFNQELSSLYDTKPPISKAKITAITRSAIRAIKFYKHVVQSVEKFILKCKPEYKVPALYVIDSLVRQSRHQFQDKDVFGPRFARNLKVTFQHLYQVPPEDKSKIIRVLNLWQKNEVFTPDVIHPLFDMADPNHPIHRELAELQARNGVENKGGMKPSPGSASKHGSDAHSSSASGKPANQNDLLQQLQHLQSLLQNHGDKDSKVKFDKKLLDFDYGEEENDEEKNQTAADALGSILNNPEVLRQLQTLQNQTQSQFQKIDFESLQRDRERDKKEQELQMQEKEFDKHLAAALPKLPFASVCDFKPDDVTSSNSSFQHYNLQSQSTTAFPNMDMSVPPPGYPKKESTDFDERIPPFVQTQSTPVVPPPQPQQQQPVVIDLDKIDSGSDSNDKSYRKRSHRSRSTSRSRRHRSRSRSSRRRRSRSYERDREEKVERYFDKDKEAERRKKSLPPFKKNHLAVCSTTLWIGHLSKLVQEEELSDTFGEYGDVVSINLIPPRGCAFVCMNRRQDAAKALHKLKNTKLQGKTITLAWAPGKGMKDKDWKDFWEVQDGVSYIPYDRLSKDIDYDYLEDGGVFDEDTVPLWLKDHLKSIRKKQEDEAQNDTETPTVSSTKGDVLPSSGVSGSELPPGFIPLPDGPLPNASDREKGSTPGPVTSIAMPLAPMPTVSQSNSTSLPPGLGPHLLMPPFGLPRLLGPMGMAMGPGGLMSNVPLGVPPPGLYKVHQQLLNRMPPPGNVFNQNIGEFPDGMLPLPFGLQHLQNALQHQQQQQQQQQPGGAQSANKDSSSDKTSSDSLLLGGPPFPMGGQFPPNLPLMSVPPPSIRPSTPSIASTIQNLSVPPPSIGKKNDKPAPSAEDDDDDDVVMEDSTPDNRDKDKKDERDDRRNYKDNRDKDRHRERDNRERDSRESRDRHRDRNERDRDRNNEREDRWGGGRFNNRGGRGGSNNNNNRDRNNRDNNNRTSRWNQDSSENNHEDKTGANDKPWGKSNNRNSNTNTNDNNKGKDEQHMNHPPLNFIGPPPGSNTGPPGPPGPLLRGPPPPHFMRPPGPPGPPHMFGPRNNMDGFRPRFDSPNNRNQQDNVEDYEGFPLEHRFPPGGGGGPPRRGGPGGDFDEPNFRDNFPPRGDNFGPRGNDNFPPRGDFPPRGPPFMPPQGDRNFGPRGPPGPPGPMDNFGPRGPPPPFGPRGPDMHPPGGPPRPLMGIRNPMGPSDIRRNMDAPPAIEPFRPRNPKAFGLRGMGPSPLGSIPRGAFRFQGPGQSPGLAGKGGNSGDDFDNRSGGSGAGNTGPRKSWKEQQGGNRQGDEPRSKRSRWGENSEETTVEKDNQDKTSDPPPKTLETNGNTEEVSSNVPDKSGSNVPDTVAEPLADNNTPKQTVIPDNPVETPKPEVTPAAPTQNENKPDSVEEKAVFSSPPAEQIKHPEPTRKQEELPTQGPGESITKIEETKPSEEIVCDSTVD